MDHTIAHRVAIDHLRKAGRWQEQSFAVAEDEPAAAVDLLPAPALVRPDTLLARSEDVRLVRAALARLPDKYRVRLVIAAIDELDYPTIAVCWA